MSVAVSDVRTAAPELRDPTYVPDSEVTIAIGRAVSQLSIEAWALIPTDRDLATTWLAAHYLAVAHPELSQTPGARVRVWEDAGAADAGALGATRYGLLLSGLINSTIAARFPICP